MDTRNTKMDKVLEDVFEAFFAVIELLADTKIKQGVGYFMCYNIISTLMNNREISLKYKDLFDAKTRLKELFDFFGEKLGQLKYSVEKVERFHYVKAQVISTRGTRVLGLGKAPLKADAEQIAAEEAITSLSKMGFYKPLPDTYKNFCT
jgi:dsRNA-specific ribonuclease